MLCVWKAARAENQGGKSHPVHVPQKKGLHRSTVYNLGFQEKSQRSVYMLPSKVKNSLWVTSKMIPVWEKSFKQPNRLHSHMPLRACFLGPILESFLNVFPAGIRRNCWGNFCLFVCLFVIKPQGCRLLCSLTWEKLQFFVFFKPTRGNCHCWHLHKPGKQKRWPWISF